MYTATQTTNLSYGWNLFIESCWNFVHFSGDLQKTSLRSSSPVVRKSWKVIEKIWKILAQLEVSTVSLSNPKFICNTMLKPYCWKCLFFAALPFSCTSAVLFPVVAFLWKRNVSDKERKLAIVVWNMTGLHLFMVTGDRDGHSLIEE